MSANFSNASTGVSTGDINQFVFNGTNGIACSFTSATSTGLYYTTNNGTTWNSSNITTGRFYTASINGTYAVAGGYDGQGIYYSSNSGQT